MRPSSDAASKIWPFKLHEGNQPYDVVNKTLIQPKTYGPKGSGAYWSDYDWEKASRLGMKYAGLPFSGKSKVARYELRKNSVTIRKMKELANAGKGPGTFIDANLKDRFLRKVR